MPTETLNSDVVLGVVVAVSALIILLGFWLYARQLKDLVSRNQNPEDRLLAWRTPFIVRIAMIDAICLLNLVMLLVSGSSIFLYIYIAAAAIMMYTKPQPWKVADELGLEKL
jgi:hypothetical protein